MITFVLAAMTAGQLPLANVGYEELVAGQTDSAITVMADNAGHAEDPARLINLGIAHARNGDFQQARTLFARAYYSREWVELETATGQWVDSRVLALKALDMLDSGEFGSAGQLARK